MPAAYEEIQMVQTQSKNYFPSNRTIRANSINWLKIFREFNVDGGGFIPINEFKQKVGAAAEDLELRESEVRRLLEDVDHNTDQRIDFSEFSLLMCKVIHMRMTHLILRAAKIVLPRSMREEPFSYLQQYNCWPPPIFIFGITLIELASYAYYAATDSTGGLVIYGSVPIYNQLIYNPHKRKEVWRFLTYMLIHIDIYHITFNCLVQSLLGLPLELVHKCWRVGLVYLVGVLAGSLASSVTDPMTYLVGASGGSYALLAAHLANLVVNWAEMELAVIRLVLLVTIIGADLSISIYGRYSGLASQSKISYAAHFGGFVAGLLLGILVLRNFRLKAWERAARWVALVGIVFLTGVCVVLNVYYLPNDNTGWIY